METGQAGVDVSAFPAAFPAGSSKTISPTGSVACTMRETAILRTLSELDRWKRRRDELRAELGFFSRDRTLRAELEKVERQVTYYEALTRDMKREVKPAGIADLLRTFLKA